MIPTRHRAKIPRGRSFPVGAETLSAALSETPQFSLLTLFFTARSRFFESEFRELLSSGQPVPLLKLEHSVRDDWAIRIYPVPSDWRSSVRGAIEQFGLPSLAAWLRAVGSDGHMFRLLWNPPKSELLVERFPSGG